MPEIEEVEYDIDPKDLRLISTTHLVRVDSSVNKVANTFVSFTLPTNIKVEMVKNGRNKRTGESHEDHPCAY